MPNEPLLASELYAISRSARCHGDDRCHWCGAPCKQFYRHDDPPPMLGVRPSRLARRPADHFICVGCWLFRFKRTTVNLLGGGQLDRQEVRRHSWLVTPEGAWGVWTQRCRQVLYERLLSPPRLFFLALLSSPEEVNHLQLVEVNDHPEVKASTPLRFTLDNVPHTWSVHELEEGLLNGPQGREPGVRALIDHLGPYQGLAKDDRPRGRGRPRKEEEQVGKASRVVVTSGAALSL